MFFLTLNIAGLFSLSAQQADYEKIDSKYFKRLYKLNDSLYRSEQPSKKAYLQLEELGIKTVINFRRVKRHPKSARATSLNLVSYPLKAGELTEDQLLGALKLIQSAEKPVLIHCWHGSDRTGAVAAASRIIFENWSNERAIKELKTEGFAHHARRFPNVAALLKELDEDSMPKEPGL